MTSQDYIKVEHVRTWLLRSSLAKFRQFHSECCFLILLQFISSCLHGPCSVFAFGVLCFLCFVLHARTGIFDFLVWNLQSVIRWNPCFRKVFRFFVFVFNDGALNLFRHMVELSESVNMSGPARTLLNLKMSRLHFLVLVLQVSNSSDLNSFFFTFCVV